MFLHKKRTIEITAISLTLKTIQDKQIGYWVLPTDYSYNNGFFSENMISLINFFAP